MHNTDTHTRTYTDTDTHAHIDTDTDTQTYRQVDSQIYTYRIYLYKSKAHIKPWFQKNGGVQCSKVNKRLGKKQKGLIQMPG